MKWLWRAMLFAVDQLAPLPRCLFEDWRIRRQIRARANSSLDLDAEAYLLLERDVLKESHRAALGLRDQLQRRAQGYLMAVTVATSFAFGAVGLLAKAASNSQGAVHPVGWPMRALLFAVLCSFFMSAVSALRVMGPSDIYDLWLRSQLPIDSEQQKANLIRFTQLNEAYAMAYERQLRGSYVAMRNGIVLVFVTLAVAVAKMGLTL